MPPTHERPGGVRRRGVRDHACSPLPLVPAAPGPHGGQPRSGTGGHAPAIRHDPMVRGRERPEEFPGSSGHRSDRAARPPSVVACYVVLAQVCLPKRAGPGARGEPCERPLVRAAAVWEPNRASPPTRWRDRGPGRTCSRCRGPGSPHRERANAPALLSPGRGIRCQPRGPAAPCCPHRTAGGTARTRDAATPSAHGPAPMVRAPTAAAVGPAPIAQAWMASTPVVASALATRGPSIAGRSCLAPSATLASTNRDGADCVRPQVHEWQPAVLV